VPCNADLIRRLQIKLIRHYSDLIAICDWSMLVY
jgi:hypothetical protein